VDDQYVYCNGYNFDTGSQTGYAKVSYW